MNEFKSTIDAYISRTGSGKSYEAMKRAVNQGGKTIIAVPTLRLSDEYEKKLKGLHLAVYNSFKVEVVNSHAQPFEFPDTRTYFYHVVSNIDREAENAIVVTTHETLLRVIKDARKEFVEWRLVIDEAINFFETQDFDFTNITRDGFANAFEFKYLGYYGLCEVSINRDSKCTLEEILSGSKKDSFWNTKEGLRLLNYVYSPYFTTYVSEEDVDKLELDKPTASDKCSGNLSFLSIIAPHALNIFKKVSILSASFDKTVLCKLLNKTGVEVKFRYGSGGKSLKHDNGHRLCIYYAVDGKYTRTFRQYTSNDEGMDNEERIAKHFLSEYIKDNYFIYNANVSSRKKGIYLDYADEVSGGRNGGQGALVAEMFGVNSYSKYSQALYLTSKNISNDEFRILDKFSITREEADYDRNVLSAYQFLSRTNLRDKQSNSDVFFYVGGLTVAHGVSEFYPESTVVKVNVKGVNEERWPERGNSFYMKLHRGLSEYKKNKNDIGKRRARSFVEAYDAFGATKHHDVYVFMKSLL